MVINSKGIEGIAKSVAHNLFTWEWTKALVYWLILSAGTASDLIFLMASFWMSVNANVHGLILKYMSEDQATYLTYLATTAYVALPIFIVGLAVVQTVSHIKMWNIGGFWSRLWAITFGIPAITFLVMDFVTISCSVASVSFTMPMFFVIARADSAFIFAFGSLIFFFLGKPQEKERLQEKDGIIVELKRQVETNLADSQKEITQIKQEWKQETAHINQEWQKEKQHLLGLIDQQKSDLEESKNQQAALLKVVTKSSDAALQGYSDECVSWLKSGVKSVLIDDIIKYTGHSKRKINRAIGGGLIQVSPRNKDLILVSSLMDWLKQTPAKTEDTEPDLYVVNS